MSQSSMLKPPRRRRKVLNRLVETKVWEKVSYSEYRDQVRRVYAGPKGALLWACSFVSLHSPLGDRLFRQRRFDLQGHKRILDVGSGAGQIIRHLLKYADNDASITGLDISSEMLRRARGRVRRAGLYRRRRVARRNQTDAGAARRRTGRIDCMKADLNPPCDFY